MLKSQATTKGLRLEAIKSNNFDRKNVLSKKNSKRPLKNRVPMEIPTHLSLTNFKVVALLVMVNQEI